MTSTASTRAVVTAFVEEVRSGRDPSRAHELMAATVLAHQLTSEQPVTIERSPADYVEHVAEMRAQWGAFDVVLEELIAEGGRAYARFVQHGHEQVLVDGAAVDGAPVRQITSVVYEVLDGRIQQYWIQIDRAGLLAQTSGAATEAADPPR